MNGLRLETSSKQESYEPAARRLAVALALTSVLAAGAFADDGMDAIDFIMPPQDAELTDEGVLTQVVEAGAGEKRPGPEDMVAVHFTGWSPEGEKLYSSYDLGRPALMKIENIYPGWRDVVLQMVRGEKRRFWLPDHLIAARGPKGASIFEIELLGFKGLPKPPENRERPPEGAERTLSGAFTEVLQEGTGTEHPEPDSLALVHYVGWTTDGQVFDSTHDRGRPTALPLDVVMPAFAEAVQLMVVGEKRRFWIPGPVAAGNWVGSPKGLLIFEVDLLRIMPPETLQRKPAPGAPAGKPSAAAGGSP